MDKLEKVLISFMTTLLAIWLVVINSNIERHTQETAKTNQILSELAIQVTFTNVDIKGYHMYIETNRNTSAWYLQERALIGK